MFGQRRFGVLVDLRRFFFVCCFVFDNEIIKFDNQWLSSVVVLLKEDVGQREGAGATGCSRAAKAKAREHVQCG